MIEIDGSYREGGGQILRTALSLSCLFQKTFRIFNIRKGRKRPGLMPQHLTAVRAAQMLSTAEVKGDNTGSAELSFFPREVKSGGYFFDIGTAGSTSLVLQTLVPAIVFSSMFSGTTCKAEPRLDSIVEENAGRKKGDTEKSGDKTTITLKGGTHVPLSPSFDYMADVFIPVLKMIGLDVRLSIDTYGFYPRGGGKIRAVISPAGGTLPLKVDRRGDILKLMGHSGVGNLPMSIAERQKNALSDKIYSSLRNVGFPVEVELQDVPAAGQGTFVYLQSESQHFIAGFTALGERGKKAEIVGEEAAEEFIRYYSTGAALDPYMSDQIVLYLSMCKEESEFTTSCITDHLLTNLWAIGLFHEFRYSIEGEVGWPGTVRINGP